MGVEDRDWYREAIRERERKSQAPKTHPAPSGQWFHAFVKTLVYCFAVYGFLALLVRFLR